MAWIATAVVTLRVSGAVTEAAAVASARQILDAALRASAIEAPGVRDVKVRPTFSVGDYVLYRDSSRIEFGRITTTQKGELRVILGDGRQRPFDEAKIEHPGEAKP